MPPYIAARVLYPSLFHDFDDDDDDAVMIDSDAPEPSDWSGIFSDDEIEAIANPDDGFGIPRDIDDLSGGYDGAPDVAALKRGQGEDVGLTRYAIVCDRGGEPRKSRSGRVIVPTEKAKLAPARKTLATK
ncbi:hypothetical protein QBC44DRAFT_372414 [Cladorrhinum sp. PSN332]|nr:hypothetical protein QBC44DRAFT_372414 [Cladorrhinum sp. PSN332]